MKMSKKTCRILSLVLALLLVLPQLFACTNTPAGPEEQTEETPALTEYVLVENGECRVRIVRPDEAKAGTACVTLAVELRQTLEQYAAEVKIETDWIKKGESHDDTTFEILVGDTNYPQTEALIAKVNPGAWSVHVDGNKLLVYSADEATLQKAGKALISLIKKYAVADEAGVYNVVIPAAELEQTVTPERMAGKIPAVEGAKVRCFYNPGNNCDEIIYENASAEILKDYVDKLVEGEYYLIAEHDLNGNPFYLLDNDVYTINAGYYSDTKEIRLIVEESTVQSLYGLEEDNKYTPVTTTQMTMLGVAYTTNGGTRYNNGQSILIRLCDGRFIIIDGAFNTTGHANALIKQMKEQSKDYLNGGQITIAAWVISHPHRDHWGVLTSETDLFISNKIKVQTLMFNFISAEENEKYKIQNNTTETLDQNKMATVARKLGADLIIPHVGSTYYIANLTMETLFTIESYGPNVINDFNGMCPIHKMTFTDPQTGEKCVYMSICDATGYDLRTAANTFGDYMKADISQIAHHGASTKGDDAGAMLGYSKISPELVLWTSTADSYKTLAKNDFLMNKATNPSLKKVLDAGELGKATIIPIPYTLGSETVVQMNVN